MGIIQVKAGYRAYTKNGGQSGPSLCCTKRGTRYCHLGPAPKLSRLRLLARLSACAALRAGTLHRHWRVITQSEIFWNLCYPRLQSFNGGGSISMYCLSRRRKPNDQSSSANHWKSLLQRPYRHYTMEYFRDRPQPLNRRIALSARSLLAARCVSVADIRRFPSTLFCRYA